MIPPVVALAAICGNALQTVNTGARVIAKVHTDNGRIVYHGQSQIDGVPGTAAPIELTFMLGHILLIEVVDGGRFRVRLHGARLVDQMRHDHTGRFIDAWPYQPAKNDLLDACAVVLETRRPHVVSGKVSSPMSVAYEALWLPLAADGCTIDMLMCGKHYAERR